MEPRLPLSLDDFRSNLQRLIAKFQADQAHYLSKAYPEAQARIDFITPFFKALGWDVENEAGLAHQEREVIVERAEEGLRPDYNFGGQTKFFVEAKAPSEPLDLARHDRMVALVKRMLELNKQKHSGKLAPSDLEGLEREIAATDAEIDELVYELHRITDEERKIIEGAL
jgi:hypothetical protein